MHSVFEYAKNHVPLLAGGLVGLLVLWYLVKRGGSSAATSTSGSAVTANPGLSAANDIANAQTNAQITTAQIQGQVASNQIAAGLQATAITTAAQLSATQGQTAAQVAIALDTNATALATARDKDSSIVSTQKLLSDQAVAQTKIQGDTISKLGATEGATQVQLAQIAAHTQISAQGIIASQIALAEDPTKQGSVKEALKAIAPIIALETGQGSAGAGIAAANAGVDIAKAGSTARNISAVGSAATGILGALFG